MFSMMKGYTSMSMPTGYKSVSMPTLVTLGFAVLGVLVSLSWSSRSGSTSAGSDATHVHFAVDHAANAMEELSTKLVMKFQTKTKLNCPKSRLNDGPLPLRWMLVQNFNEQATSGKVHGVEKLQSLIQCLFGTTYGWNAAKASKVQELVEHSGDEFSFEEKDEAAEAIAKLRNQLEAARRLHKENDRLLSDKRAELKRLQKAIADAKASPDSTDKQQNLMEAETSTRKEVEQLEELLHDRPKPDSRLTEPFDPPPKDFMSIARQFATWVEGLEEAEAEARAQRAAGRGRG